MTVIGNTKLFNVVLHEPEIPSNTGNIGRTCVGSGASLHLIEPLGFEISNSQLKRAGLDYWKHLDWFLHKSWQEWLSTVKNPDRIFFFTTKTDKPLESEEFQPGDWLVFGKETSGLPAELLGGFDGRRLAVPMYGPIRSYNLANTVSVAAYEVLRQFRKKRLI